MTDILFAALMVVVLPALVCGVLLKAFQSLGPLPSANLAPPRRRWDVHVDGRFCDVCRSIAAGFPPEDVEAHLRMHEEPADDRI